MQDTITTVQAAAVPVHALVPVRVPEEEEQVAVKKTHTKTPAQKKEQQTGSLKQKLSNKPSCSSYGIYLSNYRLNLACKMQSDFIKTSQAIVYQGTSVQDDTSFADDLSAFDLFRVS